MAANSSPRFSPQSPFRVIICLGLMIILLIPLPALGTEPALGLSRNPKALQDWQQVAQLVPGDGELGQAFGYDADVDGDTIVVGSYSDDHIPGYCPNCGSASVFEKSAGSWAGALEIAKLTAGDADSQDGFGVAVAMSGDTIVIGASGDDASKGSVYVFVKPPSGWADMTHTAKLTASDGNWGDYFGNDVAISGDTIAVGAPYASIDGKDSQGAVYVFERPVSGWYTMTETAKLTASDGLANNYLGTSIGIDGGTIVTGGHGHDNGAGVGSGKAYIFVRPAGSWVDDTENAQLTASDTLQQDFFGWSVKIDGDTIVVGAIGDDIGSVTDCGSAYIYQHTTWSGNYTEDAKLTATDGAWMDNFGNAVDVSGQEVIIGAYYDDIDSQPDQGSVYLFTMPPGGWDDMTETEKLVSGDGIASDRFGQAVSTDGSTILGGSSKHNTGMGSVYLFIAQVEYAFKLFMPYCSR